MGRKTLMGMALSVVTIIVALVVYDKFVKGKI